MACFTFSGRITALLQVKTAGNRKKHRETEKVADKTINEWAKKGMFATGLNIRTMADPQTKTMTFPVSEREEEWKWLWRYQVDCDILVGRHDELDLPWHHRRGQTLFLMGMSVRCLLGAFRHQQGDTPRPKGVFPLLRQQRGQYRRIESIIAHWSLAVAA